MRAMKPLSPLLCLLLVTGSAYAQSQLPACQGGSPSRWNNCTGRWLNTNGDKYEGEWRDGKPSGFGVQTFASGEKYTGTWKDGKYEGQGTIAAANGTVISQGTWSANQLVRPTNPAVAQISEAQRQENERKAAQLEQERVRLAQERERLDAEKLQRQQAQQREQEEKLKLAQPEALAVQSGKRIALVMGNSKYIHRPLKNPINDADDISKALKSANFEVIDVREATLTQMRTAVRQFGDRLLQNDVGLVYYSGHGVEVKGKNYFIPVNADIQREDEIVDQSLDVSLILEKMTTAGKGVNILIVDACRDDPFGRSFRSTSRGLATMDAPTGTIIAYATSPGRVASDGDSRNSPYTKALVKAMQTPNKPIEQVFKEVRRSVREETKNQQTPWENTSLSGDFYFRVQK